MIIIEGGSASGKSTELIKRFIKDNTPSMLVTDELTLRDINSIINKLINEGYYMGDGQKIIKTEQYTNCNSDYFNILMNESSENIYVDIQFSRDFFDKIKNYCLELEKEYGYKFTLIRQLPLNSKIEGINIVNIEV